MTGVGPADWAPDACVSCELRSAGVHGGLFFHLLACLCALLLAAYFVRKLVLVQPWTWEKASRLGEGEDGAERSKKITKELEGGRLSLRWLLCFAFR